MVYKKLEDLTASELRTELKRAGIKGKYVKTQAIMRLTTFLIDVSEDPLTFEFDPEVPVDEVGETNMDDYIVTDNSESTAETIAAAVTTLVQSITSGGGSSSIPMVTLPANPTPFVSNRSASMSTTTVTTSSVSSPNASPYSSLGSFIPVSSSVTGLNQFQGVPMNPWGQLYPGMYGIPPTSVANQHGMPQLYPGTPQMIPGYPQMSTMSPWGMMGSMGPWANQGFPSPITTAGAPSVSPSGNSAVLNTALADFAGVCPPPSRNSETKNIKIVSGQYDTGKREVKERQNWPQVMIDNVLNPETVVYDDMNWASFTAGMTGKILAEMQVGGVDNATINKMKHLNRIANYGMKTQMKSILNFNAVLFRAIENRSLSWDNWEKIELFHTRHLSSLTVAAASSRTEFVDDQQQSSGQNNTNPNDKKVEGAENKKLRLHTTSHHFCFKFNKGQCEHEDDHDLNHGVTVIHACGKCSLFNRGVVKTHGSHECKSHFWPPLFRSKHHTTGGGVVQQ